MKIVQFVPQNYDVFGNDVYASVFIVVTDPTNNPASLTSTLIVNYIETTNGVDVHKTISIPGLTRRKIFEDQIQGDHLQMSWKLDSMIDEQSSPPTTICQLKLNSIYVDKPESSPNAGDAKITIKATSDYEIQYSINDGVSWQTSPTFTGLHGGLLQVKVKDSNPLNCIKESSVTIPVTTSLLTGEPVVTFSNGNTSRWNAAFNPIVFNYNRRDLAVTDITAYTVVNKPSLAKLKVNGDVSKIREEEKVYVNAGLYKGTFTIKNVSAGVVVIDATYITDAGGDHTGYINSNTIRPYYKILTQITSFHPETGETQTITSTNRPDNTGLIKADLSNFLQSLLQVKDNSNYTQINYRDNNLSASYRLAYAEDWDGKRAVGEDLQFTEIDATYYVVYAAKQLGEQYGGNLAAYVPFKTGSPAKWITDFAEPAYSNNYPFDIGFIYSEDLQGLQLYCEITMLDINRQPLLGGPENVSLLNEDNSWLLQQDSGRFLINRQTTGNMNLYPDRLGLNRLLVDYPFPNDAYYFKLTLKYDEDEVAHAVTRTQTIRIDKAGDDTSVYLRWIGLTGAWNYYRFVYNQEVSLDVQNAVIIKNYVTDWQNQQGIEEVISKSAGQKIKVFAEDLSVNDIKGLQSIKYSPKAQMLVSKNPVKWQTVIVNTATYSEYETRNGQGPFSIMFSVPAINVQSQ